MVQWYIGTPFHHEINVTKFKVSEMKINNFLAFDKKKGKKYT